jgi:hypothetical protein
MTSTITDVLNRIMIFVLGIVAVLLISCGNFQQGGMPERTTDEPGLSNDADYLLLPPRNTRLTKAQALQIALRYASDHGWKTRSVWDGMPRFKRKAREWGVFLNVEGQGGPMCVYVNDETKAVRHVQGE